MDEDVKKRLTEEFSEYMNSNIAEDHLDIAIRVLETVVKYEKDTSPYATSEIALLTEAKDVLEGFQLDMIDHSV